MMPIGNPLSGMAGAPQTLSDAYVSRRPEPIGAANGTNSEEHNTAPETNGVVPRGRENGSMPHPEWRDADGPFG
jgi:hypothetical protein